MAIPTISWNENLPAGSEFRALGDNRIRELKQQLREIIEVDHFMESAGQHDDWGKHTKISLIEQADLGTGTAGKPILGAQPDENGSTKSELVYVDADDNKIQITRDGYLNLDVGFFSNNVNIVARSADGLSLMPLIKLTATNKVEIPDGAKLVSSAAPVEDSGIANKKYVDDGLVAAIADAVSQAVAAAMAAIQLGNPVALNLNTVYQATTQGFFIGFINAGTNGGGGDLEAYMDGNLNPTTVMAYASGWRVDSTFSSSSGNRKNSFCIPVPKDKYYKALLTSFGGAPSVSLWFIPLGS